MAEIDYGISLKEFRKAVNKLEMEHVIKMYDGQPLTSDEAVNAFIYIALEDDSNESLLAITEFWCDWGKKCKRFYTTYKDDIIDYISDTYDGDYEVFTILAKHYHPPLTMSDVFYQSDVFKRIMVLLYIKGKVDDLLEELRVN